MHKGINFKDQSQVLHTDSFVNKVDNANNYRPQKVHGQLSYNEDVEDMVPIDFEFCIISCAE